MADTLNSINSRRNCLNILPRVPLRSVSAAIPVRLMSSETGSRDGGEEDGVRAAAICGANDNERATSSPLPPLIRRRIKSCLNQIATIKCVFLCW